MEKVVIFGATGMTGLCALDAAVKGGYNVRAFVRNESKIPEALKDKIEIVVGNVLNQPDVDKAVEGVDKVVVALGTNNDVKPTTDLSTGMKNIINAMKSKNVDVVSVCLSAFLFLDADKVPPVFKDLNADHQRMYDVLKESDRNYIAVFPPHIANDLPSGKIVTEFDKSPGRAVSKWDLGKFLIDCLKKPEFYKRVVGIITTAE